MIKADISMKRDMDLIRKMLLAIESDEHGFAPDNIEISGYTQEQILYHALLLGEAGLAKVFETTSQGDKSPQAVVTRLTWTGHEFLDSARDHQIWNQAKDSIAKVGAASLQIWMIVLTSFIMKKLQINP